MIKKMIYGILARMSRLLNCRRIPTVVCYHQIGSGDGKYAVSREKFRQQMRWLSKQSDFLVTFDDGDPSIIGISDILEQYRIKPMIFINSANADDRLIKHAVKKGWIIGSHGRNHIDLTRVDRDDLARELAGSKLDLERKSGTRVVNLAYPYGKFNKRVEKAAKKAGYKRAFGVNSYPDPERFSQPRSIVTGDMDLAEFIDSLSPLAFKLRYWVFKLR